MGDESACKAGTGWIFDRAAQGLGQGSRGQEKGQADDEEEPSRKWKERMHSQNYPPGKGQIPGENLVVN